MAGAIIIACGIGILLLILVGYVLVGSILSSADITASAQKDMTALKVEQLNTNIDITYAEWEKFDSVPNRYHVGLVIRNTGNVKIDFKKMGVVIAMKNPDPPTYYWNGSGTNFELIFDRFTSDASCNYNVPNQNQWDPGAYLCGSIYNIPTSGGYGVYPPVMLYAFTGNGVSESRGIVKNVWA